jgi:hypothetical protein
MSMASFEDVCTSLCELIGVEPPLLQPDAMGAVGFTVTYRQAVVAFEQAQFGSDAGLVMTVEFGAPPPEQELEVLRHLLDANFLMGGAGAPAFERDPASGRISLRRSLLLSQVAVQDLYGDIAEAAEAVAQWRDAHFLDDDDVPHETPAASELA